MTKLMKRKCTVLELHPQKNILMDKTPLFYTQLHSHPRSTVSGLTSVGFFPKRMSMKLHGLHQKSGAEPSF